MTKKLIKNLIINSIQTKLKIAQDNELIEAIEKISQAMIWALKNENKILIAGNGGSAADAQHFAAELSGKFIKERPGLSAIALTTNTSNLTAISNDYGYENIFSRQLQSLGKKDDIFIGISTSGNSANLIKALALAKEKNIITIGLLGKNGGQMKNFCDLSFIVPSDNVQNIQESHSLIMHILCQIIDDAF